MDELANERMNKIQDFLWGKKENEKGKNSIIPPCRSGVHLHPKLQNQLALSRLLCLHFSRLIEVTGLHSKVEG